MINWVTEVCSSIAAGKKIAIARQMLALLSRGSWPFSKRSHASGQLSFSRFLSGLICQLSRSSGLAREESHASGLLPESLPSFFASPSRPPPTHSSPLCAANSSPAAAAAAAAASCSIITLFIRFFYFNVSPLGSNSN
jgi:hypothetical protein